MAGATPIYSFPYPESSDLVAAYPALGQDLAEDVETVIAAIPPGGLSHIATESFSAVSSVSLNGVFTSDYDNYRIILTGTSDVDRDPRIRMRASGTDDSTANSYVSQQLIVSGASVTGARTTTKFVILGTLQSGLTNIIAFEIVKPFLAEATAMYAINTRNFSGAVFQTSSVIHNQTVSYDGFSLIANAGNITGTLRVYGYANS
jgi:hypothetical protein